MHIEGSKSYLKSIPSSFLFNSFLSNRFSSSFSGSASLPSRAIRLYETKKPGKTNKKNRFTEQKEREGFEPSIVLCSELYRFSRPELSTTRPSLQKTIFILLLPNRTWPYELIPSLCIESRKRYRA